MGVSESDIGLRSTSKPHHVDSRPGTGLPAAPCFPERRPARVGVPRVFRFAFRTLPEGKARSFPTRCGRRVDIPLQR
jgi:hypothetical protein